MNTVLGQKIKQTQKFLTDGSRVPVTEIAVAGNRIVGLKSQEKHGYAALQLGFGNRKNPTKAQKGLLKGAQENKAPYFVREVRLKDAKEAEGLPQIGEIIMADTVLKPGDIIDVTGTSKGKGFAGGVKRFHFKGGPRTHGQSDRERAPGSIGQTTTPGRVYKGKRMAGKMGFEKATVKNLQVIAVDSNRVLVMGLIPGMPKAYVEIKKVGENKKFVPMMQEEGKEEAAPAQAA